MLPRSEKINAFTLVELAIVITISGLLIGGVLKGQELLENARLTSIANNIKAYDTALITFKDIYKGKPGDLVNARELITGCTAANNCNNGNGDSSVGVMSSTDYSIASEQTQFWKQLSLAGLINGIDPSASTPAYGKSHPSNPIVGGYVVSSDNSVANSDLQGNYVGRFNLNWFATWVFDVTSGWPAKPKQAWQLDVKLDDGKPFTGSVRAGSQPMNGGACEADSSGNLNNYNPANTSEQYNCEFHYILEQ